jgi:hypothetical protein
MTDAHRVKPYSLRIKDELKARAKREAKNNHRSLNVEIGLLIEDGLRWRERAHRGSD